jgi:hypothetical protein
LPGNLRAAEPINVALSASVMLNPLLDFIWRKVVA